jgi:DNA repair exonuclease SbcCD ATPase subunit
MSVITDEYKREIQKIKMQLSDQIEENVRLKGFKQMVLEKPDDFHKDKSSETDTKTHIHEFYGELEMLRKENIKLKTKVNELEGTLGGAQNINDNHQRYNGKLQTELTEVKEDNKKLSHQIEDIKMTAMRKSGM